jgi:RNA polymerase sigma-70 factor (ECF subfamily)
MSLHAARLPARLDASGELLSLFDQDRSQWDSRLIEEGQRLLERSASGTELTEFHLEAAIAWTHAAAPRAEDTNWRQIISLYDQLIAMRPSPVVALNRAIAIAQLEGTERGLDEIRAIPNSDRLAAYPFFHTTLGEFESRAGHTDVACGHFRAALALARNPMEQRFLQNRLAACEMAAATTASAAAAARRGT